jgi:hypothetical protein
VESTHHSATQSRQVHFLSIRATRTGLVTRASVRNPKWHLPFSLAKGDEHHGT